ENEMKTIEPMHQEELQKQRHAYEAMKHEFIEKEKNYNKLVKLLEEKNATLGRYCQKLIRDKKKQGNNEPFLSSWFSAFTFDLFRSAKMVKAFDGHSGYVNSIQFSPFDNSRSLCSCSDDATIRVWDVGTFKQMKTIHGHSDKVYCVKFSLYHRNYQHRTIICSAANDKTIRFWDLETEKEFHIFREHEDGVCSIQFSLFSSGKYLCSASKDQTIRLWDIETAKPLCILSGHTKGVCCVEFSPPQNNHGKDNGNIELIGGAGYTICSGSSDKTVRLWDVETNKELLVFRGHECTVNSVKYSSSGGNIICSGSDDKTVRLWDIRLKQEILVLKGHTNCVSCIEYSPFETTNNESNVIADSTVICSASFDNTVRFWDVRTHKQLHEIRNNSPILCLAFSQLKEKKDCNDNAGCGYTLCYGSSKGSICLWE
ncbi:WD-40 repeat-containing protein, partial [Reticulomyxa filosa]